MSIAKRWISVLDDPNYHYILQPPQQPPPAKRPRAASPEPDSPTARSEWLKLQSKRIVEYIKSFGVSNTAKIDFELRFRLAANGWPLAEA